MLGFDKEPEMEKTDQVFFLFDQNFFFFFIKNFFSFLSKIFSFWSNFFSFWSNFFFFLIKKFFLLKNHTQMLRKIHQGSSADYRNGKSELLADEVSTFDICFWKKKLLSWNMPFRILISFFFSEQGGVGKFHIVKGHGKKSSPCCGWTLY